MYKCSTTFDWCGKKNKSSTINFNHDNIFHRLQPLSYMWFSLWLVLKECAALRMKEWIAYLPSWHIYSWHFNVQLVIADHHKPFKYQFLACVHVAFSFGRVVSIWMIVVGLSIHSTFMCPVEPVLEDHPMGHNCVLWREVVFGCRFNTLKY